MLPSARASTDPASTSISMIGISQYRLRALRNRQNSSKKPITCENLSLPQDRAVESELVGHRPGLSCTRLPIRGGLRLRAQPQRIAPKQPDEYCSRRYYDEIYDRQ